MNKKIWLTATGLLLLGSVTCFLFWYYDWKYTRPTPVPEKYAVVNPGQRIDIPERILPGHTKPIFLHFFNPDCPCSRFNIPHFKSLVARYGYKVDFAVVLMAKDKDYTAAQIQQRFSLDVPVIKDTSLAALCGVYATPQAVLLGTDHTLYYRGNYNRSRYCTNENSNYAQMAIDSLLQHNPHPVFNRYALTAYGCSLPTCNK